MTGLKPYPEYKDSGVEWIGEIPKDWDMSRLKYLTTIITGNTPPKSNEQNYLNGIIPWVKPDNLSDDYSISETKEKLSEEGIKQARIIPENSALVCCIGTVGKIAVNNEKVTTNQQINSIIFDKEKELDSLYGLYSVISAKDEYVKHANTVVVSILNKTAQENIKMPLPDVSTQKKIAKFIRCKTKEVDFLISDKERLIELLEEKRQAIITETVTKGLDPNVKMKKSSIKGIGEIPEHWEVIRLKYLLSINPPKSEVNRNEDYEVTFIPMENLLSNGDVDYSLIRKINEVYNGYTYFKNEDIIMAKVTPCFENGNIAVVKNLKNEIGFGTTELHVLRPKERIKVRFLYYILNSEMFKQEGVSTMYGVGGLKRIPAQFISDYRIGLPTIEEQARILKEIDRISIDIEYLITKQEQIINKLGEYRESLIYEAVTGKIDLRNYKPETINH